MWTSQRTVTNMAVTFYTLLWAVLALASFAGLYLFNKRRGLLAFLTDRKYLIFFLIASLIGMRQYHLVALALLAISLFLMWRDYYPYVEKCRRLKAMQEAKH